MKQPVAHSLLLALAALSLLGCSPRLAGTNDAALEYAVDREAVSREAGTAPGAAVAVKARLAAARVPADVELTSQGRVRVVIDADIAGAIDDLVLWRGGLDLFVADDAFVLAPGDTSGLRPMSAARDDGPIERWWQGPGDAVARVVRQVVTRGELDGSRRVFAERLPDGEWRTRVVRAPAVVTLGVGDRPFSWITPADGGRALALGLAPEARAPLLAIRDRQPQARIAVARGSALLSTLPIEQATSATLVVSFGQDITAYARAQRTRLLLRSPVLAPMHRIAFDRLPARVGLAAACALLPFVLSFAWLFFVRRFDRARPEPLWLVLSTFALGGLSVVPAALVEVTLAAMTPWLDPSLVTLGGQLRAMPIALVAFTLSPGMVEEGAKFLGSWTLARHRREFDEPVDGIVYGCAAALGFAAVENVKYFALGRMSGALIAIRAFMTVPAHLFFGALWGYAMGQRLVSRRTSVLAFFALAALAHGAFDAVLSIEGTAPVAALIILVLALSFVDLLRRALRHGAVAAARGGSTEETTPLSERVSVSTLERLSFRVGSPLAFYGSAAAMIATAFGLTVLGTTYEILQHRVGVVFVVLATGLLALFGLAARGASATIPLDVVLDARGITYAGGSTPWKGLLGVDVEPAGLARAFVRVHGARETIRLGPTSPARAEGMARAIAAAAGISLAGPGSVSGAHAPIADGPP